MIVGYEKSVGSPLAAHYYGKKKKRKIGRPPGGHTNLENGEGKPGQRRKRRKLILTHRKKGFNAGARCGDSDGAWGDNRGTNAAEKRESDGGAAPAQKKRKYMHRTLPPTEIRTRWARRPKFTFERRTHQKILLGLAKKTSPKPARHAKPAQKRSAFQVRHRDREPTRRVGQHQTVLPLTSCYFVLFSYFCENPVEVVR